MSTLRRRQFFTLLLSLSSFAPLALAQSSISGVVHDSTGAVMSGVSVEAASPALIERSRTVTTDGEGRYAIVDIRPGTYTMTFSMQGFSSTRQEVEVPSNVTVPIDAEMRVGAVGETVNVSASVATVDVENAARPTVLSRNDMDALPTARNPQSLGSYVPGVHLNTPDVGGSMQVQQTYISAHGNAPHNTTYLLDGMLVNTTQNDGQIQTYIDNAIVQETTYQTNNITAEVQAGGVLANMIPKDGGNEFHAEVFLAFVGSSFVGNNGTADLTARGLVGQSAVNRINDFDGSFGGPIKRNKLWFLLTGRYQRSDLQSPGSFYADGSPGIEKDWIWTGTARFTYQATPKNKVALMWTRDWKTIKDDIVSGAGGYNDTNPDIASLHRDPVMYYILQARWTGTVTPKLIFQAGYSFDKLDYDVTYQPGIQQAPFTPEWYAGVSKLDLTLLTRSNAGGVNNYYKFERHVFTASGLYVNGSHQVKFGVQDNWGIAFANSIANGDLIANFNNGVPATVSVQDTPTYSKPRLNADLGLFAMDTWHYKRLSVTGGVRWEYWNGQIDASTAPAGRFVPARNFAQVDCNTVKGLGCFKNWSPRVGVVWDVFGNHKTAIKGGFGKYNTPIASSVLNNFNPMFLASQTIAWTDTNKNGYPDGGYGGGEIAANGNPQFGVLQGRTLDPNFKREYNLQWNVGVQQEVHKGITANFSWTLRKNYDPILVTNSAVPASAWIQTSIVNPLDGSSVPVFNLDPKYFGLSPVVYQTNSSDSSTKSDTYQGFETSLNARLPRNAFVFFGWTYDRILDKSCDQTTGSNLLNDPNSLRFCDWTGGSYQDLGKVTGVPWRNEFKLVGSVPIKWGIELSGSLYADPVYSTNFATNTAGTTSSTLSNSAQAAFAGQVSGFSQVNWTITSSTRYPANCSACPNDATTPTLKAIVDPGLKQGSELIPLVSPGARLTPRLNQLDVAVRKWFTLREKYRISGEAQIFNILNSSTVLTESFSLGTSITPFVSGGPGGTPSVIANPRMLRLAMQFKF
jgi:hypothetical protein